MHSLLLIFRSTPSVILRTEGIFLPSSLTAISGRESRESKEAKFTSEQQKVGASFSVEAFEGFFFNTRGEKKERNRYK